MCVVMLSVCGSAWQSAIDTEYSRAALTLCVAVEAVHEAEVRRGSVVRWQSWCVSVRARLYTAGRAPGSNLWKGAPPGLRPLFVEPTHQCIRRYSVAIFRFSIIQYFPFLCFLFRGEVVLVAGILSILPGRSR